MKIQKKILLIIVYKRQRPDSESSDVVEELLSLLQNQTRKLECISQVRSTHVFLNTSLSNHQIFKKSQTSSFFSGFFTPHSSILSCNASKSSSGKFNFSTKLFSDRPVDFQSFRHFRSRLYAAPSSRTWQPQNILLPFQEYGRFFL